MPEKEERTVFIAVQDKTCAKCGEELGRGRWFTLVGDDKRLLCLACAGLDKLVHLPPGDAALTMRARKYSTIDAVLVQWKRARKRFERQGVLVEAAALKQAEAECAADEAERAQRREREALRRDKLDQNYVQRFAQRIRELYPSCPAGTEQAVAEHACRKGSGRVGRSAAAKEFDPEMIRLAVMAHIRHAHTKYDRHLLAHGSKELARTQVEGEVWELHRAWQQPAATPPAAPAKPPRRPRKRPDAD